MKNSFRAIFAVAVATGIALPARADDTPAPDAKKAAAAKPVQTKGASDAARPEPVLSPEPAVAKQANVNIRGQAKINSEVVGHLKKGDTVTVVEEVTLKKAKQDEPSRWYKISLPTQVGVWVHSSFVENGAVKATRLNVRGGPGEEYSVLGRIEKGTPVKQMEAKGDWLKIEAPTNTFGYVAAHLLERTPTAIVTTPPPKTNEVAVVTPPVTVPVEPTTTPVIPEPPTTPATPTNAAPVNTNTAAAPVTQPVVIPPVEPEAPVEKVKKIVSREGILRGSVSIQAPTYFELRALDTGKTINYVFSPSTNLMLKEFKGQRVVVTGEELLDERWQNTPVIIVDSLQTVP